MANVQEFDLVLDSCPPAGRLIGGSCLRMRGVKRWQDCLHINSTNLVFSHQNDDQCLWHYWVDMLMRAISPLSLKTIS
jgi:hypothetical protein